MSGFVDTSIVVRYLTGDPPDLAEEAARILDADVDLHLSDVVLVEAAYVLTKVYRVPRDAVVDHLVAFIQKRNVALFALDKGTAIEGLLLCRPSGRVSFADAMIWAAARSCGIRAVYSFDQRFPSSDIEVHRRG